MQLSGWIEIIVSRHLNRGEFSEVAALFVMPPTFEQSSGRDIGLRLHSFNELM